MRCWRLGALLILGSYLGVACSGGQQTSGGQLPVQDPRGELRGEKYVFRGPPAFRFKVPPKATPVERVHSEAQVVRLETPDRATVAAVVVAVDGNFKLQQAGMHYLAVLEQTIGRDHELIGNQVLKLRDGTRAIETRIRWFHVDKNREILTVLVSALKQDFLVMVTAHNAADGVDLAWVPRSLRFSWR